MADEEDRENIEEEKDEEPQQESGDHKVQRSDGLEVQNALRTFVWLLIVLPTLGWLYSFYGIAIKPLPRGQTFLGIFDSYVSMKDGWGWSLVAIVVMLVVAEVITDMIHVLPQWKRAIVFRFGQFDKVAGPGPFIVPPFFWAVPSEVALWTITRSIAASKVLTKDNIVVDVDAAIFYAINKDSPEHAVINVEDYAEATMEAAQAALREAIGAHPLPDLQAQRQSVGDTLKETIDKLVEQWGVRVSAVRIKDIQIPIDLQQAMSRAAQADQELKARVTLGQSELQIAEAFVKAAQMYKDTPGAMELRGMNITAEAVVNGKNTVLLIPARALDSAGISGLAAFAATNKPAESGEKK